MMRLISALIVVFVFAFQAPEVQAQNDRVVMPPEHRLIPGDFPDAPMFRPESDEGPVSVLIRDVRAIMDEMLANGMRDEFLTNRVSWKVLRENVARGEQYIQHCAPIPFEFVTQQMRDDKSGLGERKLHLISLQNRIERQIQDLEARFYRAWDRHQRGPSGRMLEESEEELREQLAELGLRQVGNDLSRQGSRTLGPLFRCAGSILGYLTFAKDVFEVTVVSTEAIEMYQIRSELFERIELRAYLEVLIHQYENLEGAYDELFNRLVNAFSADQCQECVEKANLLEAPENCPAASEPPRPNRGGDVGRHVLPTGQELVVEESGRQTLFDRNGRQQAFFENGKTTVLDRNGNPAREIPFQMTINEMNRILESLQ